MPMSPSMIFTAIDLCDTSCLAGWLAGWYGIGRTRPATPRFLLLRTSSHLRLRYRALLLAWALRNAKPEHTHHAKIEAGER
jgi:hypothetical protein